MSARYVAMRFEGGAWENFESHVTEADVRDILRDVLPAGMHRGHVRAANGTEVGFVAEVTRFRGTMTNMDLLMDGET